MYPCRVDLGCASLFGTYETHRCVECGQVYYVDVPVCGLGEGEPSLPGPIARPACRRSGSGPVAFASTPACGGE